MVMGVMGVECIVGGTITKFMTVHASPPRPYMTKSESFAMTRFSQLYLTRPGNQLVCFWFSGSMHDMPGVM